MRVGLIEDDTHIKDTLWLRMSTAVITFIVWFRVGSKRNDPIVSLHNSCFGWFKDFSQATFFWVTMWKSSKLFTNQEVGWHMGIAHNSWRACGCIRAFLEGSFYIGYTFGTTSLLLVKLVRPEPVKPVENPILDKAHCGCYLLRTYLLDIPKFKNV